MPTSTVCLVERDGRLIVPATGTPSTTTGCERPVTSTSAESSPALLDTSAAIALLVQDHDHHESTVAAVAGRPLGAGWACRL